MNQWNPNDRAKLEAQQQRAEERRDRERVEAAQHHELKLAKEAERAQRSSWWQRLARRLRKM